MTIIIFVRRYGLFLVVIGLIAAAMATGAWRWLSLSSLQAHHAELKRFVADSPALSLGAFFAAYVAVVTACIPGPGLMAVASGYLFGALIGGAVSLAGCVAGSLLVCLACRSAFAETIVRRSGPRTQKLEQALRRNAFFYLLSLKLITFAPYALTNIAAGLAGVRLSALLGATAIGSAPLCFILASLGAGLGHGLDRGMTPGHHLLRQSGVMLPLIGLSLLSLLPVVWQLARSRRS